MAARRSADWSRGLIDPPRWPGYLIGMATELAYVLILMVAALTIAFAARVIWR